MVALARRWAQRLRLPWAAPARREFDPELVDVFCVELAEIEQSLTQAVQAWRQRPADAAALKDLRRGFHTIKGSALLLGADEIGDLYRHLEHLAVQIGERPCSPGPELIEVLEQSVRLLPELSRCLREQRALPAKTRALERRVQALLR